MRRALLGIDERAFRQDGRLRLSGRGGRPMGPGVPVGERSAGQVDAAHRSHWSSRSSIGDRAVCSPDPASAVLPSSSRSCAHILAVMTAEKVGAPIGAGFGLGFVLANTGALPSGVAMVLRLLAVVAFVAVFVMLGRRRSMMRLIPPLAGRRFGRGYWLVVAVEVVAVAVGLALFNGPLHTPRAAVAWISFVVGAHFLGLAAIWKQSLFLWLGSSILLCGALGLVLAIAGSSTGAIDTVAGVLPGALLLGFAIWSSKNSRIPVAVVPASV